MSATQSVRSRSVVAALMLLAGLSGAALVLALSPSRARHSSAPAHHEAPIASLRRSGDHGELQVTGMRQPPIGEVYEVWLERKGRRPQPTDALFTVTRTGRATVEIPGSLRGVSEVMVSAEPLGGSSAPTSPAVLSVALTRSD